MHLEERAQMEVEWDVIELLRAQHREVERLLAAISRTRAPSEKSGLIAQIGDAIAVVTTLEEQVFYPGVWRAETEALLLDAMEEQMGVKRLIADILETDVEDRLFDDALALLREKFERYTDDKADGLFAAVREYLPRKRLRRLAEEMRLLNFQLRANSAPRQIILAEAARMAMA